MAWPRGIYVATKSLGVYYTNDFTDPSTQPTWAAVNTGLANVGCQEFKLDPFDPENKQYVLTTADETLYRRDNGGSWTSILTPAQALTLVSATGTIRIFSFCTDVSNEGRLWALVGNGYQVSPSGYWAIYSDTYGNSWSVAGQIYSGIYTYTGGKAIRANGNNVWVSAVAGHGRIYYSYTGGSSWNYLDFGSSGIEIVIQNNPLSAARIYYSDINDTSIKRLDAGSETVTNGDMDFDLDVLWFDSEDADHQRAIYSGHLLATIDGWSTYSDIGAVTLSLKGISIYSGGGQNMLVACTLGDHVVGAIAGEVTTVTGIAGAMAATSPYTDSIPKTCGGACIDGVQGVRASGVVYTHAVEMPGYAGAARGEPLAGDRAAYEASNYPERHTDDTNTAAGIHHTLGTGENQAASGKTVDDHINDTDNPHEVTAEQVGLGDVANILCNLNASAPPTVDDDSGDGYAVGSSWFDTTNDKAYLCLDATVGAAVWQEVGAVSSIDADNVTYTPAVNTDWDSDTDPGDVDDALDQLAERVDDIENAGGAGSDASVITYTPAVNTDWDGDTDPGNVDDALDQLAERVDDLEGAGGGGSTDVLMMQIFS